MAGMSLLHTASLRVTVYLSAARGSPCLSTTYPALPEGKQARFCGCCRDGHSPIPDPTATEQRAGNREDTFAEVTDRYSDMEGALECLFADCDFEVPSLPCLGNTNLVLFWL